VRLTYPGEAGVNYALERSSSLVTPNWRSLGTNTAPSGGVLAITNMPDTTMNNFWRIRSVPQQAGRNDSNPTMNRGNSGIGI